MIKAKEFPDNPNTYVFTTSFVIEKKSPIIFVSHDSNGDWQFLSKEGSVETEAKVLLLAEIIHLDPSIQEVADLPRGYEAYRTSRESEWKLKSH